MAVKQIVKYKRKSVPIRQQEQQAPVTEEVKNNEKKTEDKMDERISKAEEIMNNMKAAKHVKVVKKDKGLIERTESSKIVLTEDNRQVLND